MLVKYLLKYKNTKFEYFHKASFIISFKVYFYKTTDWAKKKLILNYNNNLRTKKTCT